MPETLGTYFVERKEGGRIGLPTYSVTIEDGLVPRDSLDRRTESALEADGHALVEPGDLAYNMMRMWQGALGVADRACIVSPAYVVMQPRSNVDVRFAAAWMKSDRGLNRLWAYSHGITGDRLRLYPDDFLSIPVTFPSLVEQQRIAELLETWDYAIETAESLMRRTADQRDAIARIIYAPVNQPSENDADWVACKMSDLADIIGGGTPSSTEQTFWNGDIAWCTPSDLPDLSSRFISRTSRTITEDGLHSSAATVLPVGSIVLCSRASVGECAINTVPMATNQGFQSLVAHDPTDTDFLYFMVRAIKPRLLTIAAGSTFLEFTRSELRRLKIAAPSHEMRVKIGKSLASMDDAVRLEERRVALLRRQKRGLMQALVRGEWHLPPTSYAMAPNESAVELMETAE